MDSSQVMLVVNQHKIFIIELAFIYNVQLNEMVNTDDDITDNRVFILRPMLNVKV